MWSAFIARDAVAAACISRFATGKVFSAMALVKNRLRNRLICETVESVLTVRYGLSFIETSPADFEPTSYMMKKFNSVIYSENCDDTCVDDTKAATDDIYGAIELLEDY